MSIYSNVTEQETHDIKLAESLSPITKKLDESTKKVSEVIISSNSEKENVQEIVPVEVELEDSEDENIDNKLGIKALPNSFKFSDLMKNTTNKLLSIKKSLKIDQDKGTSIKGIPVLILGGDSLKIGDNVYETTPEIHKALSSTGYTGENMKNENDIFMMNNILRDVNYTGRGDKSSQRKTFFAETLPKLKEEIQYKTFNEIDLEGQGLKIIIPSNIIGIYTRLEVLLGLKLSGHINTLTEASNLNDELYKRGETQTKQQYRNALNKFSN